MKALKKIKTDYKELKNLHIFCYNLYTYAHMHKWKQSFLSRIFIFYMLLHSNKSVLQESFVGLIIIYQP